MTKFWLILELLTAYLRGYSSIWLGMQEDAEEAHTGEAPWRNSAWQRYLPNWEL